MIKIAILDDDQKMLSDIRDIVLDALFDAPAQIDIFPNGAALDAARNTTEYDLYLLDIEIGDENGVEIGKRIRQTSARAAIIFITSHSEYALEGYEAFPIGYLVKPVQREKLSHLLRLVVESLRTPGAYVEIMENHRKITLRVEDIVAIERVNRKTIIHLYAQESYDTTESLKSLVQRLPEKHRFSCINRNAVVRIDHIASIKADTSAGNPVTMKNGKVFYASREGLRSLKQAIARER